MRTDEVQDYLADHLADLLADRLSSTVQSSIRSHMQSCPICCGEMEDFEEIQSLLRGIPLEACDSAAMRARFDSGMKEKGPVSIASDPHSIVVHARANVYPLRLIFAMLVLAVAVFAVLQTGKWKIVRDASPVDATAQSPKPIAVPETPGVITGQVRTANGVLARGVRVAVMAVSEFGTTPSMNLIRVEQTNDEGRFRLEDVPPGRYYVIAGSVDIPTYYPGTPNVSEATMVSINAGAVVENIDFPRFVPALTIRESTVSNPLPIAGETEASAARLVPVSVTVKLDSGDRLPYKPDMSIVFTGTSGGNAIAASPVVGNLFQASLPANDSYSVAVSETAAGYAILAIESGTTDLLHGGRFTAGSVSPGPLNIVVTLTKRDN